MSVNAKLHSDGWSDQEVAFLIEKWALGISASNVAKMLGRTKGAVVSKVERLGLNREVRQTPSLRTF